MSGNVGEEVYERADSGSAKCLVAEKITERFKMKRGKFEKNKEEGGERSGNLAVSEVVICVHVST